MGPERKSQKLKRLVAVQRHLEKLAEYDLASTARQREETAQSMTQVMDAIASLDGLHRPFARNYAERFTRLMTREVQLRNLQQTQEVRVLRERTKGDRLEDRMKDAREGEERTAEDNAVYDLIEMTMAADADTPASSKLRES